MNESYNIQNSPNSNINIIIGKSYEYNDLIDQLNTQEDLFALTSESNTEKRLQASGKINELKDKIEQFKRDVINLAETFDKLEINTERLKQAKAFFDKGDVGEARALLNDDNERIQGEEEFLWAKRDSYKKEIESKLMEKAEERLIQALLNKSDYANPNWFADTCRYFERSIESYANEFNVFQYAVFLQEHNQLIEAGKYYSQYLNDFSSQLSQADYAGTLNNLAVLHKTQSNYEEASKEYEEALRIYRALAETNPNTYLPDVATTLNNLAVLHRKQSNYEEASKEYEEALRIYRALAETNPNAYLPYVAGTLNNFAGLNLAKEEFEEAIQKAEESTKIYRELAITNLQAYFPDLSMNLGNLAWFYQDMMPQREKSIEYALETILILSPYSEKVPFTQKYFTKAITVLRDWNLNDEEIERLIAEKMKETGEGKA